MLRGEKEEVKPEEQTKSSSASLVSGDWSPLQLSSYNLTKPSIKSKPSLRTESLQRRPPVRPALRSFTSGRSSAEPLTTLPLPVTARTERHLVTPLPSSLSELDLRSVSTLPNLSVGSFLLIKLHSFSFCSEEKF